MYLFWGELEMSAIQCFLIGFIIILGIGLIRKRRLIRKRGLVRVLYWYMLVFLGKMLVCVMNVLEPLMRRVTKLTKMLTAACESEMSREN